MFRACVTELTDWFRTFLESVPGNIGCYLRRCLYGFVTVPGTRVLAHVRIYYPEKLVIGRNSFISSYTQINAGAGIHIGDNVLIGPGVMIWSQNHKFSSLDTPINKQGFDRAKVTIEEDVWIAAGAIVLPGVCIARGTVVAAGAVVTRSTQAFSIVAGVPAKMISTRSGSTQKTSKASDRPGDCDPQNNIVTAE